MKVKEHEPKLSKVVLLLTDSDFSNFKHEEKTLVNDWSYNLGYYLTYAIHDSLGAIFETTAQAGSLGALDSFDLVIKPTVIDFSAPLPLIPAMHTKTKITLQYEVTPKAPQKPFRLIATGTYEVLNNEDEKVYSSLIFNDKNTYEKSSWFPNENSQEYRKYAAKDAYIAIYHALTKLNDQLLLKLKDSE